MRYHMITPIFTYVAICVWLTNVDIDRVIDGELVGGNALPLNKHETKLSDWSIAM